MNFVSYNEQQTIKIAKEFAKSLKGGEIICLIGELGTGKTTFTKGLAKGLGVKKSIRSPSFVLIKSYLIPQLSQKLNTKDQRLKIKYQIFHIDLYRIKKLQELINLGVLEYFNQPNIITIIEWADKIKKILPKKRTEIKIKFGKKEGERKIIIQKP